jgi:hypothetical protein
MRAVGVAGGDALGLRPCGGGCGRCCAVGRGGRSAAVRDRPHSPGRRDRPRSRPRGTGAPTPAAPGGRGVTGAGGVGPVGGHGAEGRVGRDRRGTVRPHGAVAGLAGGDLQGPDVAAGRVPGQRPLAPRSPADGTQAGAAAPRVPGGPRLTPEPLHPPVLPTSRFRSPSAHRPGIWRRTVCRRPRVACSGSGPARPARLSRLATMPIAAGSDPWRRPAPSAARPSRTGPSG